MLAALQQVLWRNQLARDTNRFFISKAGKKAIANFGLITSTSKTMVYIGVYLEMMDVS